MKLILNHFFIHDKYIPNWNRLQYKLAIREVIIRALHNLTIFLLRIERADFSEVTGGLRPGGN
ncbi:MAG: hypothetical protein R6T98_08085 [Desulfatiglandales bacterium]